MIRLQMGIIRIISESQTRFYVITETHNTIRYLNYFQHNGKCERFLIINSLLRITA